MKPKFKLTKGGIQYLADGGDVLGTQNGLNSNAITNPQGSMLNPAGYVNTSGALHSAGDMDAAKTRIVGSGDISNPQGSFLNPGGFLINNNTAEQAGKGLQNIANMFVAKNNYQAQLAPTDHTNYGNIIGQAGNNALQGYGQFNQNLGNQNALAQQLMAQGMGYGPNPAMAQLANTTGQNINSQAALMAGQRGVGANPGLVARQIAQNGAGIQQNAIGQAAAQAAQQQLAAQAAAGNLYGQIGNEITGQQNANTGLFTGASGAQNTQNTGSINNYAQMQGINSQVAQNNTNASNKATGGLMNALGGGSSGMFSSFSRGGEVKENPKLSAVAKKDRFPHNLMPSHLKQMASIYHPEKMADGGMIQIPEIEGPQEEEKKQSGGGGGIMSLLPMLAALNQGGAVGDTMKSGGKVPGQAKAKGDSPKNDTVDAKLSPGEVVIPRSIMQSDDPAGNAAKFVANLASKNSKVDEEDDFKSALKKAISQRGKK